MLLAMDFKLYTESWAPFLVLGTFVGLGPGGYLLVINRTWKDKWKKKAWQFFFLNFLSAGITVNNTVAVFDAILGKKNEFLRTPKFGVVSKSDDWRNKEYVLPFTKTTLLEIFFAVYGFVAIFVSIFSGNPIFAPMVALPTIGFIYTAYLSIAHSSFKKKQRATAASKTLEPAIEANAGGTLSAAGTRTIRAGASHNANQKLVLAGVVLFIIVGAAVAYSGYSSTIYPVNQALGYLIRAQSAQTPEQIAEYMVLAKQNLPADGNPVWLFQTVRTDFALIRTAIDDVLTRAEVSESMDPHSGAYNVALIDMHNTANALETNLLEAMPYMYVGLQNIALASIWVVAIIGIFAAMRKVNNKTRARYEQQYKAI
jgi:hypothetical protein